MPRTYTTTRTVYQFDELTPEAQETALSKLWDTNVDQEWWEWTYDDAERIGMRITNFDIDRGSYLKAEFTEHPLEICRLIIRDHGKDTSTYKVVLSYLNDCDNLSKQGIARVCQEEADQLCECFSHARGVFSVGPCYFDEDIFEDANEDFHADLKDEYLNMLRREYEYLTSPEAIIETIEANEYEFTEKGELI